MSEPHGNLARQLRRHGLLADDLPAALAEWRAFLQSISRSYEDHDQTRYRLERALAVSSAEMQTIYDELLARSEDLAQKSSRLEAEVRRREDAEDQLRHEATHDPLTQLPNRAMMLERLERQIAAIRRGVATRFAVLFLDLDKFKIINDSLGHHIGDDLLTAVAERLQRCLRDLDTVIRPGRGFTARLGGDEFVLLLEGISGPEAAMRVAERVRAAISEPMQLDGHRVNVGASVGITVCEDAEQSAADLLREADTAMYFAKHSGKSRCSMFNQKMQEAAVTRLRLESQLRAAMSRSEFVLHYQPIVDLTTHQLASVEALVRWHHPDGSLVAPGVFVSVAEEMGLIGELGRWVLGEACRQVATWNAQLPDERRVTACVNISRRQVFEGDLARDLREALEESGLDARRLKIEITENLIMSEPDHAARVLDEVREMGVQVLMDDFGTGYSSLSCLHHFGVDGLKIDRAFVEMLEPDNHYAAVVETIVRLAHVLDKPVVCEGIETRQQLEMARDLGCDYGQGFLLSKPLPAQECWALLSSWPGAGRQVA